MRRAIDYLLLFFKGAAMGAADVVPGVSGGTIAFISGIYEELLNTIRAVNIQSLKLLLRGQVTAFWTAINGNFIAVLFSGILLSILSLAKLVSYAMREHPILVWSFFFGLIVASILWMTRSLGRWRWRESAAILCGAVMAAALSMAPTGVVSSDLPMIFGAGALAICAMILPGISGSFILVLIGIYTTLIQAIDQLNVPLLATFAAGCVVGLLLFARLLGWLLGHYRSLTLALLTGFLVGSLAIVWPWKIELAVMHKTSGEKIVLDSLNRLPGDYALQTGMEPHTLLAVLLMVFGVVLVLGLEHIGGRKKSL